MTNSEWLVCTKPDEMLDYLEQINHPLLGEAWAEYLLTTGAHFTCEFPEEHVQACDAIRRLVTFPMAS